MATNSVKETVIPITIKNPIDGEFSGEMRYTLQPNTRYTVNMVLSADGSVDYREDGILYIGNWKIEGNELVVNLTDTRNSNTVRSYVLEIEQSNTRARIKGNLFSKFDGEGSVVGNLLYADFQ